MNAKLYKTALPVIFLLLLALPTILSVAGINERFPLSERRTLSKFPEYNLKQTGQFIDKFEAYFNDHFGGRTLIIRAYSLLKYFGLGVSPYPKEVELGKDGWFYLGNNKSSISHEHSGLKLLNDERMNQIENQLIKRKNQLDKKGIKFYLLITPDKHTIYPENLPRYYSKKFINRNTDKIYISLKNKLNLIDIRDELIFHKSQQENNLYHRTDSHWNDYGAYFAYKKIIATLSINFPSIGSAKGIKRFKIKETKSRQNTTTDMINLTDVIKSDKDFTFTYHGKVLRKLPNELTLPNSKRINPKDYEVRFKSESGNKLKILVFRDSFSGRLMKFLSLHFNESIFISNFHKYDQTIIDNEKPDIVILQIVERSAMERLVSF